MTIQEVQDLLEQAIYEQTANNVAQHGYYKNRNEFYGVLAEELDELKEAYSNGLNEIYAEVLPSSMLYMREKCNRKDYIETTASIQEKLMELLKETIHVMCVFKKLEAQEHYEVNRNETI